MAAQRARPGAADARRRAADGRAGRGRIVNVVSTSGKRPSLRNAAYSVTKAAQLSLSRAYAEAWVAQGVLVNAVAPGLTASELWSGKGGLADQTVAAGGAAGPQSRDGGRRRESPARPLRRAARRSRR